MTDHPASTAGAPARAASASPLRRLARWVLIVGTVLAVAASFGPVWVVRAGVVVAIVAAVVACVYAWREVAAERRQGAAALLDASREHHQALTAERRHNGEVVDVLTTRVEQARAELTQRRTEIGTLRVTVSTLRGDLAALRLDLGQRDATIESLRDTVAAREAELVLLGATDDAADDAVDDAEVHAWPRHIRAGMATALAPVPDATTTGEFPTVVDLPAVADLRAIDGPVGSLANYEPQVGRA